MAKSVSQHSLVRTIQKLRVPCRFFICEPTSFGCFRFPTWKQTDHTRSRKAHLVTCESFFLLRLARGLGEGVDWQHHEDDQGKWRHGCRRHEAASVELLPAWSLNPVDIQCVCCWHVTYFSPCMCIANSQPRNSTPSTVLNPVQQDLASVRRPLAGLPAIRYPLICAFV